MRYIVIFFMLLSSLYAQKLLNPLYTYKVTQGLATDVLYNNGSLYISSDSGTVDIYDTKTKKKRKSIKLEKIKDFMGDAIDSKIFTLDFLDQTLLILSQDNGGYSRVNLYKNKKNAQIISSDQKLNIIKAKFIDKDTILLALISNDIISYNIKTKKKNWTTQASMSKFSNFALNNDRSTVAIADESGEVHLIDTKTGNKLKTLSGQNVDNLFGVAFAGDIVLTGGQDRRAGVYNVKNGSAYYKASNFFVYGVGLSPSGKRGAYSCDIDDNVEVFNTATRESLGKYRSTKKVVNSIYFINEHEFFINSSAKTVGYYKVK
ncbi:WD40 repeat domain-containing protein [Sulfurimonas paralvinellae]|uniref:PQQ-binding-like beta-propeller repeat protein n=1 Tax=Sulfurimonas paralvinellae TaxID=317658 RepID=A0A7M1B6H2_9BACT|nr:PQQ-binding-like beta-propeller repeat protein [Sulfurimonas paralvinellae]QOP45301.1 PQQ-binding-like beta-propeller repeat protein [Sulfurimonas paralvinellae]